MYWNCLELMIKPTLCIVHDFTEKIALEYEVGEKDPGTKFSTFFVTGLVIG